MCIWHPIFGEAKPRWFLLSRTGLPYVMPFTTSVCEWPYHWLSTHDTHVKYTMVERQLPYNITNIYLHLDSISHLYWTLEPTEQQTHSILNDWRTMWTQQIPTCTNLPLLLMPTRYITACDEFYLVFVLQATNVWVRRPGTKLHSCRIDSWPYLPWPDKVCDNFSGMACSKLLIQNL